MAKKISWYNKIPGISSDDPKLQFLSIVGAFVLLLGIFGIIFAPGTIDTSETTQKYIVTPVENSEIFIDTSSDDYFVNLMKSTLTIVNVEIKSIQVVDGRSTGGFKGVIVAYESQGVTVEGIVFEIGAVTGALLEVIDRGWDVEGMSVVVADQLGIGIALWQVNNDKIDLYKSGALTKEEVAVAALLTFENI